MRDGFIAGYGPIELAEGGGETAARCRECLEAERGKDLRLALEAQHAFSIARKHFRQDFQRHVTAKARVPRAIHLTHPARANRTQDLIGSQSNAGGQ